MRKVLGIVLRVVLGILVVAVVARAGLALFAKYKGANYYTFTEPAGDVEKRFTGLGGHEVASASYDAGDDLCKQHKVWYPTDMADGEKYPLVIVVNGTGSTADTYESQMRHLASWGFIVAGNMDQNTHTGASAAKTLDYVLALNEDASGPLFGRVDADHIGIGGHSQGGVGVINAGTAQPHGSRYAAMYTASATGNYWGQDSALGPEWAYDVSKVRIPYLMTAGTGAFDAGTATDITATEGQGISPLYDMLRNFGAVPAGVPKVMARAVDKDHGDMPACGDAYMTAWFAYWLQGDADAGAAFFGSDAEILANPNWQDVQVSE